MAGEIDAHNLDFPTRIPEKLKAIREHLGLTPDEIAPPVGARTGAEILAYENDEDDLLVTVLWKYSNLAGCPMDQIVCDNLEIKFPGAQRTSQGFFARSDKEVS